MKPIYIGKATAEEIDLATRIAERNAQLTLEGKLPQEELCTDEPMPRLNIRGYLAEGVYCRHFKLESTLREGQLARVDCIQDGKTVDVKSATFMKAHLCVYRDKIKHPADLYALMIAIPLDQSGKNFDFSFAGLTTKEELFKEDKTKPTGYAHFNDELVPGIFSWVMRQDELWAIEPADPEEADAK